MTGKHKPKWHLLLRPRLAACGLFQPRFHTADPAGVTCSKCKKSLYMADQEVRMYGLPEQPTV